MSICGFREKILTECFVNGERIIYDTCSTNELEAAKGYYKKSFKYIGSGNTIYYNGKLSKDTIIHHFFIKK